MELPFHQILLRTLLGTLKVQRTPTTIIPSLIGLYIAGQNDLYSFILMGLTVFFLHSSANALNDIADYNADLINSPDRLSVLKILSRRQMVALSSILLVIGLSTSFILDWILFIIVGSIGTILLIAYNFGARLKDRPIGSVIYLSLSTSTIPFLGGFIVMRNLNSNSFIFALALAFLTTPIIIDSLKDVLGDSVTGKQTLAVFLGPEMIRKFISVLILLPIAIYPLLWYWYSLSPNYLILATIPLSLRSLSVSMLLLKQRLLSIRILIRVILAIDFFILALGEPIIGFIWT
jgi:4-hydroxybenzoate polyprenyltransferase